MLGGARGGRGVGGGAMCEAWLWNEGKLETYALLARRCGRGVLGAARSGCVPSSRAMR